MHRRDVMELGLKDKVAVVTGGSRGIGRGVALALAKEGCRVAIAARGKDDLRRTSEEIRSSNAEVLALSADMTEPEDVRHFVDEIITNFRTIHILVNNVGGIGGFSPFEELTDDDWSKVIDLNVMSAVRMTRAALPYMRRQKFGRIVNIASESGIQPDPLMPHYNSAKAAVLNLTKSLSKAYGRENILINAVSPATIRTKLVEGLLEKEARKRGINVEEAVAVFMKEFRPGIVLERPGLPEEVAAAVVFLVSGRASFITGANLRVDGGSVQSISC
jgi:3-oxoacyl-[acyl-carrier protein] reductase